MTTSYRTFLMDLYTEYLEEASFLYEQRLNLLKNPEITWRKIGEFEERFEAHIDGLVVGEELALEVCSKQAEQGDFGQLHAIVRVLCRQKRKDLLFTTLEKTDPTDLERLKAVTEALKYELPIAWHRDIQLLLKVKPALSPTVMTALGYQRAEIVEDLLRILQSSSPNYALDLLWSAGRIRSTSFERELRDYLESTDEGVRSAAALALLRLGNQRALHRCERFRDGEAWQWIPLGLGGTRSTARALLDSSNASNAADDCLVALGLLGDISAIPTLLANLANPERASAAANALQLISGANFSEKVLIPDETEEDAEFGTTVVRFSQKPDDWAGWWAEHELAFDPRVRYRYGKPYSPLVLLEGLYCEKTPHKFRQLAYEELVIRYGMSIPFEADMFVSDQIKALQQIDQWIQANNGRFREGVWYFQGNLMYG